MTLDQQPAFVPAVPASNAPATVEVAPPLATPPDSLRPDAKSVDTPKATTPANTRSSDEWQDDCSDTFRTGWMAACGIPIRTATKTGSMKTCATRWNPS